MNHLLLGVELAFILISQGLWTGILLFVWLQRRFRLKLPVYRRPRRRPENLAQDNRPHHRAKPEWVLKKVIYLASHLRTCRGVTHAFNRGYGHRASVRKSWVAQILSAHAGEIAQMRRERKRRKAFFIPVAHTWALDLTLLQSPYGHTFTVLGIIDAGSRKLLHLDLSPGKCAFALLGHLFIAISRHGLPAVIRTDNEAMFASAIWRVTLKALGIIHRRGPPYQPWHNGRIERLWGTLKAPLRKMRLASATALQKTLDEFTNFYNHHRPHQALDGLTPEEAWQGLTMADVQQANPHAEGNWVQALGGQLMAYHIRP